MPLDIDAVKCADLAIAIHKVSERSFAEDVVGATLLVGSQYVLKVAEQQNVNIARARAVFLDEAGRAFDSLAKKDKRAAS